MEKRISNILLTIVLLGSLIMNTLVAFAENFNLVGLDASQFVTSVLLSNTDGPLGNNKISDSSSVNIKYNLEVGDGNLIDTSQPYTMNLPTEFKRQTVVPIELFNQNGVKLATVEIRDGIVSIQFDDNVKTMKNVKVFFDFWENFDKTTLNYTDGNDLLFPTKENPENAIHVNFSKSGSGGGSGTSAISKLLTYDDTDPTIVNWTITVNNGGYEVQDAVFKDVMENMQVYIVGSAQITYRNWNKKTIYTYTNDLIFTENSDGTKKTE